MKMLIDILTFALKIPTGYMALTGACFLLPRKGNPIAPQDTHFAVLIPARNEEAVISSIIHSLQQQRYPKEKFDIFVVPNNCTDHTEAAAEAAGARILHCLSPVKTKGEVLHQSFAQLRGQYDAYCVFDADNLVHPDFLARMNDAIAAGARIAKSRQIASNPYDSWISGCYDIYFQNFNLLYNRPRASLRLSAKLIGTGFMITDSLLEEMGGWNTCTLTEDMEFAAQCAQRGVRIHYVPEALNYDEQPNSFRASMRQRRRWSAGVQSVANRFVPRLLMSRPNWLRLDMGINLMMIYVQLLAFIPVLYALLGLAPLALGQALLLSLAGFWLSMTATALFLTLTNGRDVRKMWKSILLYPLFTASWYPLHFWSLFAKPKSWKPIAHQGSRKLSRSPIFPVR